MLFKGIFLVVIDYFHTRLFLAEWRIVSLILQLIQFLFVQKIIMKRAFSTVLSALIAVGAIGAGKAVYATPTEADGLTERCDYLPHDEEEPTVSMACSFIEDENGVSILWADGVYSEFEAFREAHDGTPVGLYLDKRGGIVRPETGLGSNVRQYQMEQGYVVVYL